MTINKNLKRALLVPLVVVLTHCATTSDQRIEEAQFLLDKAKYAEAVAKIRPVVTADPTNTEASFILASALLGGAVLGNNTSYLGYISQIQVDQASTEATPYTTFARIAPPAARIVDLKEARDLLISLGAATATSHSKYSDIYLQLYVARLFEIAGIVTVTGAGSADSLCNADHNIPNRDGIPDDFNPDAATTDELARFQDNLANVNNDGVKAGLPTDFGLNSRISTIATDFQNATTASDFLKSAFGDPTNAALCVL